MEIGIIGLPWAGKTTVFNAVTSGNLAVTGYSDKPNIGVAKVPDKRIEKLADMYKPKKVISAQVTYVDVPPPPEGFGKTRGIGGEYLNALQSNDALMVVTRAFENPSVAHVDETIDPTRDAENMIMEMIFSDIGVLDRRLPRIEDSYKGANSQERGALTQEKELLVKVKGKLEDGIALKDQGLSDDEAKRMVGFGFLSIKPLILVMNIGEDQLPQMETLEKEIAGVFQGVHVRTAVVCAQLEMELVQMDPEEEREFREDMGVGESSLSRMVKLSYDVVDQISFFTVGEDEVRAWEIPRNTVAQHAAGTIHSDLQRGFIRAEVISYENLVECGGLVEARKRGFLRQEGKDYVLSDGEIMHVLFNL